MVDRLITLFESTDRDFSTNGIGPLPDAISCKVSEERNGPYELEMEYPITGQFYEEILFRRILFVKPNPYSNRQPFRIYSISKPISGRVIINAQHISYDLSNYTVSPFSATNIGEAFASLQNSMDDLDNCPFTFWTDKETAADMHFSVPMNARTLLGGIEGSILDTYRGEYEWDCYTIKLWNIRGGDHTNPDRGVSIRYGKNLTDIRQEENISEVYTAIRPYWYRAPNNTQSTIEYDPETGEAIEPLSTEDDNSGLVELSDEGKTVSNNLIIDSIPSSTFDNNGKIVSTEGNYKILYAKVQNGIHYTIRFDGETTAIGGFFSEIPAIGSTAVNGKESITADEFVASIDGYVAFVVAGDYNYSIVDRLPYRIMFIDAYSEYVRILPLDLTNEFNEKPTEDELAVVALLYANEHDLGSPKVSIEVSFINLSDSSEYSDIALLETVKLCDAVDVVFPKLGVSATAKVVKTNYDVLAGRYESIELGSVKSDLSTTISVSNKETRERVTQTELEAAVSEATRLITGQTGGYVVLNPPEHPQEILIMNKPYIQNDDPTKVADKVWRWNSGGLGYSKTGYFGKYELAITSSGVINADFIKSGSMSASHIFGGTLELGKNWTSDPDHPEQEERSAGSLIVYNENDEVVGQFNKNGLFLYGTNGFYLIANPDERIGFAGMQMLAGNTTPHPLPDYEGDPVDERLFWINKDMFHMKRAVVENDITFFERMRLIPISVYDSSPTPQKIHDGIAFVASS